MKKTYSNPELEVVMLNMNQQLMAGSVEVSEEPINAGDVGTPGFVEIDELDLFKNM